MKRSTTDQHQVAAAADTLRRLCPPSSDLGLLFRAEGEDHLDALVAIVALRARLCELENAHAISALHNGATFQRVSVALGLSKRRARQRWDRTASKSDGDDTASAHPR